jgi:hydroxylysine kinase
VIEDGVTTGGRGLTDQGGLTAAHVRMQVPEACALTERLYGVDGEARRLDTEKDDTFQLLEPGGGRLILKVSNPAESRAEIEFQVALLDHLGRRDPTLPVPAVVPDRDGGQVVAIVDGAGQKRLIRVLTFVEGMPLDRAPSSPILRRHVGGVLARLRLAMADFDHPGADRSLAWDVRHLLDLAGDLDAIPDPGHRTQLQRGLERFAVIAPAVAELRRQVLHNDFSRSNLIVDGADPNRLAGVIDFGDAVRTAIAIDVSTALLNQLPRDIGDDLEADIFAAGRDLLAGYLELADLTPEELALLPHLVMGRVIARAIITHRRAALFPDNAPYIMRNTEQGWTQLEWFLARSPAQVSAIFNDRSPNLEESAR